MKTIQYLFALALCLLVLFAAVNMQIYGTPTKPYIREGLDSVVSTVDVSNTYPNNNSQFAGTVENLVVNITMTFRVTSSNETANVTHTCYVPSNNNTQIAEVSIPLTNNYTHSKTVRMYPYIYVITISAPSTIFSILTTPPPTLITSKMNAALSIVSERPLVSSVTTTTIAATSSVAAYDITTTITAGINMADTYSKLPSYIAFGAFYRNTTIPTGNTGYYYSLRRSGVDTTTLFSTIGTSPSIVSTVSETAVYLPSGQVYTYGSTAGNGSVVIQDYDRKVEYTNKKGKIITYPNGTIWTYNDISVSSYSITTVSTESTYIPEIPATTKTPVTPATPATPMSLDDYIAAYYGSQLSGGTGTFGSSAYMLKTNIVPPVCPMCPGSVGGGCCTNCGGNGGAGTAGVSAGATGTTLDENSSIMKSLRELKNSLSKIIGDGDSFSGDTGTTGTTTAVSTVATGATGTFNYNANSALSSVPQSTSSTTQSTSSTTQPDNEDQSVTSKLSTWIHGKANAVSNRIRSPTANQSQSGSSSNVGITDTSPPAFAPITNPGQISISSMYGALNNTTSDYVPLTTSFSAFGK